MILNVKKDSNRNLLTIQVDSENIEYVSTNRNGKGVYIKFLRPISPEQDTMIHFPEKVE